MVKKKKAIHKKETSVKKHTIPAPFFMGLTKPQTQSLAVGIIAAGLFLFGLATFSWKNAEKQQMAAVATPMITPTDSGTISLTPTLTQMISATSTARLNPKQPLIKELPNTTSKVTYTVEMNDNIASIGEKLCQSERAWLSLVATNNLVDPYTIQPGETLIITCN